MTLYFSLAILALIAFGITFLAYHRARQAAKFDADFASFMEALAEQEDETRLWREGYNAATGNVVRLSYELDDLRAALIDIRNQGLNSKSGTARSMANKAKDALK